MCCDKINPVILQHLAVFFVSINIVACGLEYGWPAAALIQLQDLNNTNVNLHLTPAEGSWAAIGPTLGMILGSPLTGLFLDKIGRKRMILLTFFPFTISWITIAYATNPWILFLGRFISGIGDGCIYTTAPVYISEIANPKIRGFLGSSVPVCLILGVVLVNIFGIFLSVSSAALLCTIFPITSFIGMLFMPESPYHFLIKNNMKKARLALKTIRGTEDVDEELEIMKNALKIEKEESNGKFKDIFMTPSNRRAFLIMMLLRGTEQFSGITALVFYIPFILKESGASSYSSETICSLIFFISLLIMSIIGSCLVDRSGRRVLLLCSAIGSAIALLIEAIYFQCQKDGIDLSGWHFTPITALLIYVIFFGFGLQNIPTLMLSELFPTNIRALSLGLADIYYAFLESFVSKYFQTIDSSIGSYFAFYTFALSCVIGSILIYFFVPETKGITLEEIQNLLKSNDNKSKESNKKIKYSLYD